jgi:predicted nucleic acid-binding protein
MVFLIDTNVIIRYLVGDHPEFLKQATELFEQVERGDTKIVIAGQRYYGGIFRPDQVLQTTQG